MDLNALADWLLALGVDRVALESTGVSRIPLYEVLEQRGLKVWLVNARPMKYVPGRNSDVQDCQWLQKLMSLGLLRAVWRPDGEVWVGRAVARQREVLITEHASWVQRMQKSLVQMNIQPTDVLADIMGMTGQAIIRTIVIARHLLECDAKLQALLDQRSQARVDLGKTPKAGGKYRVEFDVRQAVTNWAGVDLTRINGLGVTVMMKLLSEIGPDVSRFASVKHLCSWLGLCPGTKISGGKVLSSGTKRSASRARQALKMAAMNLSHSDSALGAFLLQAVQPDGKPRANAATAHKLARMVYFHADPRRGLRRSGPATLRRAAA